jgi:two-component system, OmpR family, response regulator
MSSHQLLIWLPSMGRVRVLIVEDEPKMAGLLRRGLTERGDVVEAVDSGEDAVALARVEAFDVILLDVMLPGIDGFATCRELRRHRVWTPVLMLTARAAVADRIHGLDGGADDYLTKPFAFDELLARMRALVRRGPVERPAVLTVGDLRLDPAAQRVWRGEAEIHLSTRELSLLETFMRRPDQVLTRGQLLEQAWDVAYDGGSNVVDVYVRYLREKIDRPFDRNTLATVRGVGYRLGAADA